MITIWQKHDFVFDNGILIGFSESGLEKLKETDTLIIPEGVVRIDFTKSKLFGIKYLELPESLKVIGAGAFMDSSIRKIRGGENVEVIEYDAFSSSHLKEVLNFKSLKKIGNSAFQDNRISSFYFSDNLEMIEEFAFENNDFEKLNLSNVKNVTIKSFAFKSNKITEFIPAQKGELEVYAFMFNDFETFPKSKMIQKGRDITSLKTESKSITPKCNSSWDAYDFNIKEDTLISLSDKGLKKLRTSLTIPRILGVTKISPGFFTPYKNLKSVYISDGIKVLSKYQFQRTNIEYVRLPETLEEVHLCAFAESMVKEVVFPENLNTLSPNAFRKSCVERVDLSKTKIKEIKYNTFENSFFLKEIKLPNTLERIERNAFDTTPSLKYIEIPKSVKVIDDCAFYHSGIETVKFEFNNEIEEIGNNAFSYSGIKEFHFDRLTNLKKIKDGAFAGTDIEIVKLNQPSVEIGQFAFTENILKEVYIRNAEIKEYAFSNGEIEKVVLSGCVELHEHAFLCNEIKELATTGENIVLEEGAFAKNNLEFVELKGVSKMSSSGFKCNPIKSISIPDGLTITD